MKKKFALSSCCMIVACLFYSCGLEKTDYPDLIIHNAKVYTVDAQKSTYEAISITDGLISHLGSSEEILSTQDPSTEILDAQGALVLPGLIEGHGHFSGLGQSLMNLNFLKSKSWDEIVEMVKQRVSEVDTGVWIMGRGWHQEKWEETPHDHVHGYPRHFDLSEIAPDNPVMLRHASGHGLIANKKAMDIAGVTNETQDPSGGAIIRDRDGEAIGVFEERAMEIIRNAYNYYLEEQSDEQKIKEWYDGIALAQNECLTNGITSFQDAGAQFAELERYTQLAEEGNMDIRLWSMVRHSSKDLEGKLSDIRMIDVGGGYFTCRAIKTAVDGALGSFGAWLIEPYDDKPGFVGQNTYEIEEVEDIAKLALAADMQLCVHAIGDKANQVVLDLMEPYYQNSSNKDLRWRIEHSQHLHPDDIPRFGELGVIASMQGIHCTSDSPYVEKRLGEQRAREGAYNWRAIIDSGGLVTNGTDAPVEDIDPIESYYASVTRKRVDSDIPFFPENKMSREEGIYSYTMANAIAAFEEETKGSLEVGKYGDITILSEDWLTCSDDEILDTKILYTIVEGDIRYAHSED